MSRSLILSLLLLGFLGSGCDTHAPDGDAPAFAVEGASLGGDEPTSPDVLLALGEDPPALYSDVTKLTLPLGENNTLGDGFIVSFQKVVHDSRCPLEATCLWEGQARARFVVVANGRTYKIELDIPGGVKEVPLKEAHSASAAGHTFSFLQLAPYPTGSAEGHELVDVPIATLGVQRCGSRCGNSLATGGG